MDALSVLLLGWCKEVEEDDGFFFLSFLASLLDVGLLDLEEESPLGLMLL